MGWIHHATVIAIIHYWAAKEKTIDLTFQKHTPVEFSRNKIAKMTLDDGYSHVLMLDDDTVPIKDPLELLEHDPDIVICPTPMYKGRRETILAGGFPIVWNVFDYDKLQVRWHEHQMEEGLQEIDAGGTGCFLIARRVLEHPAMKHPFSRCWDEDGMVTVGSDIHFCHRAKEAGFKIWTHSDYVCRHYKELEIVSLKETSTYRDIAYANRPNINTTEYWDAQWAKREEQILPYYEMVAEMCKDKTVLDYGCGRGDLLAMIAKVAKSAQGVDFSQKAVDICRARGLQADLAITTTRRWDMIVCTEVLEHLDDDAELLQEFFRHTNTVVYGVPHNTLPPAIEPEHRRVYTQEYVHLITPHVKEIFQIGTYLVVVAERTDGRTL